MEKTLILYPAIGMMILTLFLYAKNYLDNRKATINKSINFSYFKTYKGEVPEYVAVSRQTLKNQFELPIFFYFLTSLVIALGAPTSARTGFGPSYTVAIKNSWMFSPM